jgi:hypothetical protein
VAAVMMLPTPPAIRAMLTPRARSRRRRLETALASAWRSSSASAAPIWRAKGGSVHDDGRVRAHLEHMAPCMML